MTTAIENASISPLKPEAPTETRVALHGRWLTAVRVLWLSIALAFIVLFLASLRPTYNYRVQFPAPAVLSSYWTPDAVRATLNALGISVNTYITASLALTIVVAAVYVAVGFLIFSRKSNDWLALYISLILVVYGTDGPIGMLAPSNAGFSAMVWTIQMVALAALIGLMYVFPNGRFVPRWSRSFALAWIPLLILATLTLWFVPGIASTASPSLVLLLTVFVAILVITFFVLILSTIAAQAYRYFRVSSRSEQQQTKWFLFGISAFMLTLIVFSTVPFFFPALVRQDVTGLVFASIGEVGTALSKALIPISIGLAILRYRLWQIDLVINRTFVYVPLTAILAGVFAISSDASKKVLQAMTGEPSDAAVISTLLVVAIFDPLKKNIETVVDKFFKQVPDPLERVRAYNEQVRGVLRILDVEENAKQLLEAVVDGFDAVGGAIYLGASANPKLLHTVGNWNDDARVVVPIEGAGVRIGRLALGPRCNGIPYSATDEKFLHENLQPLARALALVERRALDDLNVDE